MNSKDAHINDIREIMERKICIIERIFQHNGRTYCHCSLHNNMHLAHQAHTGFCGNALTRIRRNLRFTITSLTRWLPRSLLNTLAAIWCSGYFNCGINNILFNNKIKYYLGSYVISLIFTGVELMGGPLGLKKVS